MRANFNLLVFNFFKLFAIHIIATSNFSFYLNVFALSSCNLFIIVTGMYLAIRETGMCAFILSVQVYYRRCPATVIRHTNLAAVPSTSAISTVTGKYVCRFLLQNLKIKLISKHCRSIISQEMCVLLLNLNLVLLFPGVQIMLQKPILQRSFSSYAPMRETGSTPQIAEDVSASRAITILQMLVKVILIRILETNKAAALLLELYCIQFKI